MTELSWRAKRKLVYERAHGCCEYCQTSESNCGQPMHVEHIIPSAGDHVDNLCLSCARCNLSKARATSAIDPATGDLTILFNPRMQSWSEHFAWIEQGLKLKGLTATGRATIKRLQINHRISILARQGWVNAGNHPPRI